MLLYTSLIFVMSILMAVIATASSLFPQSSAFVIFFLFFLYGISSVSTLGPAEFGSPTCSCVPSHLILFSLLKHALRTEQCLSNLDFSVPAIPFFMPLFVFIYYPSLGILCPDADASF